MKTHSPIPFAPPAWQLPFLRSLNPGERGLLVVACEEQPNKFLVEIFGRKLNWLYECPLGPIGGVLACKERWLGFADILDRSFAACRHHRYFYEVTDPLPLEIIRGSWRAASTMPLPACRLFLRTLSIGLRRTDTMTESEARLAGCNGSYRWSCLPSEEFKAHWTQDHPSHPWGAWEWFVQFERVDG